MDKVFNVSELRSRIDTSVFYGELQWGDKVKLLFKFKDPHSYCDVPTRDFSSLIEDWTGNCVCTKDNVFLREGFLEVIFDTSKTVKYAEKIPYETTITVYWKDGQPTRKINEFGQMVDNDLKTKTFLSLYGSIVPG